MCIVNKEMQMFHGKKSFIILLDRNETIASFDSALIFDLA